MPKRISEKPSKEVSLVEAKNQPPANEVRIEREAVPVPSHAEICAVACALGLDPFDEKSQALAQMKLASFEYARVREEVFNWMQSDFFVGMDAIFVRRPSPETLATQPPENRQITSLIREAFLTIHAPALSVIVDDWIGETPKADRGEEREIPQEIADAIYRRLDSISSIVRTDRLGVKVRSQESQDILLADGLMRRGTYEIYHGSEQGPKRHIDDFLVSLDRQSPRWRAKDEAASFAATWSWLGPIVNKAAAYLGVKFSEKDNESEYRTPYYASVVKDGVLIPKKAEAPYAALLVGFCQEAYDEGLELRKDRRAETKVFAKMQRERRKDLEAFEADLAETKKMIALFEDRIGEANRRADKDLPHSRSTISEGQNAQERNELQTQIKRLTNERAILKGEDDGLIAKARRFFKRAEIQRITEELEPLGERLYELMAREALMERKVAEAEWNDRLFGVYQARARDMEARLESIHGELPAIRDPYLVGKDPAPFQGARMKLTALLGELNDLQKLLVDTGSRAKLEAEGNWSPLTDTERLELDEQIALHQDEEKKSTRKRTTPPKGSKRTPTVARRSDLN